MAKNTIQRYLTYLEAAFLIHRVLRVDTTPAASSAAPIKVYVTDPSMREPCSDRWTTAMRGSAHSPRPPCSASGSTRPRYASCIMRAGARARLTWCGSTRRHRGRAGRINVKWSDHRRSSAGGTARAGRFRGAEQARGGGWRRRARGSGPLPRTSAASNCGCFRWHCTATPGTRLSARPEGAGRFPATDGTWLMPNDNPRAVGDAAACCPRTGG